MGRTVTRWHRHQTGPWCTSPSGSALCWRRAGDAPGSTPLAGWELMHESRELRHDAELAQGAGARSDGWDAELELVRRVDMPQALVEQYGSVQRKCFLGFCALLHRAWFAVDERLYLWNYLGSDTDFTACPAFSSTIVSVYSFQLKASSPLYVYVDGAGASKRSAVALVVATLLDISVLIVTEDPESGELAIRRSALVVQTGAVAMLKILHTAGGRLFFAGRDGCVYELVYPRTRGGPSDAAARGVGRVKSGIVAAMRQQFGPAPHQLVNRSLSYSSSFVPMSLRSYVWERDSIVDLTVDDHRGVLYSLSEMGVVRAYTLVTHTTTPQHLFTAASSAASSRAAQGTGDDTNAQPPFSQIAVIRVHDEVRRLAPAMPRAFIAIFGVSQQVSSSISLVVISSLGERFYVSLSRNRPSMRIFGWRHPPHAVSATAGSVRFAVWSHSAALLVCSSSSSGNGGGGVSPRGSDLLVAMLCEKRPSSMPNALFGFSGLAHAPFSGYAGSMQLTELVVDREMAALEDGTAGLKVWAAESLHGSDSRNSHVGPHGSGTVDSQLWSTVGRTGAYDFGVLTNSSVLIFSRIRLVDRIRAAIVRSGAVDGGKNAQKLMQSRLCELLGEYGVVDTVRACMELAVDIHVACALHNDMNSISTVLYPFVDTFFVRGGVAVVNAAMLTSTGTRPVGGAVAGNGATLTPELSLSAGILEYVADILAPIWHEKLLVKAAKDFGLVRHAAENGMQPQLYAESPPDQDESLLLFNLELSHLMRLIDILEVVDNVLTRLPGISHVVVSETTKQHPSAGLDGQGGFSYRGNIGSASSVPGANGFGSSAPPRQQHRPSSSPPPQALWQDEVARIAAVRLIVNRALQALWLLATLQEFQVPSGASSARLTIPHDRDLEDVQFFHLLALQQQPQSFSSYGSGSMHVNIGTLSWSHEASPGQSTKPGMAVARWVSSLLIEALFATYSTDTSSPETISSALLQKCPFFFDKADAALQQGLALVRQAYAARTLSSKSYHTHEGFEHDRALQLARGAARSLRPVAARISELQLVCHEIMACGAVRDAIELALNAEAQVMDKGVHVPGLDDDDTDAVTERIRECIFELLRYCFLPIGSIDAASDFHHIEDAYAPRRNDYPTREQLDSSNEDRAAIAMDAVLENGSEVLLEHFYRFLLSLGSVGTDQLLRAPSSKVELFLYRNRPDLLWRYFVWHARFQEAADILLGIATDTSSDASLDERVSCLANALHNARAEISSGSSGSGGDVTAVATANVLVREISEKLDVARVQLRVLADLKRKVSELKQLVDETRTNDDHRQVLAAAERATTALSSKLLDLSVLYNEYAVPFDMWEAQLEIFACAGARDAPRIRSIWDHILAREFAAAEPSAPAVIRERVLALGRTIGVASSAFPVPYLLDVLERLSFVMIQRGSRSWTSAELGWIWRCLDALHVDPVLLIEVYTNLVVSPEHISSVDGIHAWTDSDATMLYILSVVDSLLRHMLTVSAHRTDLASGTLGAKAHHLVSVACTVLERHVSSSAQREALLAAFRAYL
ncbi:Nuclear pore complex protein [Porphyridium purpureum]|uniref:Nuclear pore complex protein n=1 Tax=Porphyridium purpureum TaxID=35688 RepID=A0A5J4Z8A9_PORPP|nr:Nuclear pore complex protein [Porphyridium purpureum]|eukprot:POR1017..scf295_1